MILIKLLSIKNTFVYLVVCKIPRTEVNFLLGTSQIRRTVMQKPMKKNTLKRYHTIYKSYKKYGFVGLFLLGISILCILVGLYILFEFFYKLSSTITIVNNNEEIDKDLTGMVGDFVGGIVGTLWSLTGVILFFLALRLQSKELSLQIKEMRETRNVFQIQQFENTFFNLIKTHNEIRDSIKINRNKGKSYGEEKFFSGTEAFATLKNLILEEKKQLHRNLTVMNTEKTEENELRFKEFYYLTYDEYITKENVDSKILYKMIFLRFYSELSHYFRNLYHILLFIKENEELELFENSYSTLLGEKNTILINGENIDESRIKRKYKKYAQFLQAQMSNSELFLTFYNGLFFPKMKRLIQYYDLVQNLNRDDLLEPEFDEIFYKEYYYNGEKISELKLKNKEDVLKI